MKLTLKVQANACETQTKVTALVNRCAKYGVDEIVYSMGSGVVWCKSGLIEPAVNVNSFDPLGTLIAVAGAQGVKVMAWWGPGQIPVYWTSKLSSKYPDWDVATLGSPFPSTFHFLDYRRPTVAPFIGAFVAELLQNYPALAGVTLDYFRYGFWPGCQYEVWPLYGDYCQDYIQASAQAAMAATAAAGPQYRLSLHGFSDYYGWYMGQSWDKLLDANLFHLVYPMAYYNNDFTGPVTKANTLEWAIASWAEKYRSRLAPVISSLNFTSATETLKAPADFAAQVDLCAAFSRVGIFDQRVTDEQLDAIKPVVVPPPPPPPPPPAPLPTATITATVSRWLWWRYVTLTWATTNAVKVVIDNGVGAVAASGSKTLWTTPRTFKITATNADGKTATAAVKVS